LSAYEFQQMSNTNKQQKKRSATNDGTTWSKMYLFAKTSLRTWLRYKDRALRISFNKFNHSLRTNLHSFPEQLWQLNASTLWSQNQQTISWEFLSSTNSNQFKKQKM